MHPDPDTSPDDSHLPPLTDAERQTYEWQIWTRGFGEAGQRRLRAATVLISRVGGVGGNAAYQLAAAGVGHLILAHAGDLRPSDLNRQILMTHDWVGRPRVESAARRLRELNPRLQVTALNTNLNDANAQAIVHQADLVIDAAPLFTERFPMNAAAFRAGIPIVEAAMYDLCAQITSMRAGLTPCLRCLHPTLPAAWKRQFPVFGAVAATAGAIAAAEAIKILAGIGEPLWNRLMMLDLASMTCRHFSIHPRSNCPVCGQASAAVK